MENTFKVEVDGTKTLEQMIADGKYDQDKFGFCKEQPSFDITNKTKRTEIIKLFYFDKNKKGMSQMYSQHIEMSMKKKGFRLSTVEELLALGAQYPALQRKFPIIAFGSLSMATDRRSAPCYNVAPKLDTDEAGRITRSTPVYYTLEERSNNTRFAGTMITRES